MKCLVEMKFLNVQENLVLLKVLEPNQVWDIRLVLDIMEDKNIINNLSLGINTL